MTGAVYQIEGHVEPKTTPASTGIKYVQGPPQYRRAFETVMDKAEAAVYLSMNETQVSSSAIDSGESDG